MTVVRHSDPDRFLAAAGPALARDPASASFFHSLALGLKRHPPPAAERVYLATCADAGSVAAAVQRAENAVIVETAVPALAAQFADDLADEHPTLQGVGGPHAACEAFAQRWHERTRRAHVVRVHMRHHMLTAVAPVPAIAGRMRSATQDDLDWLLEASLAFITDAGIPDSPARVARNVPQFLARGRYRLWDDDGPAAFAGWSDAGDDAARIAPVYTPPGRRRRGYATALVAALSQELLDAGRARLFLMTDLSNPTANAIYARIGFRRVSELYHFDFVAPAVP